MTIDDVFERAERFLYRHHADDGWPKPPWFEHWPHKPVVNKVRGASGYVRPVGVSCFIKNGVRTPI